MRNSDAGEEREHGGVQNFLFLLSLVASYSNVYLQLVATTAEGSSDCSVTYCGVIYSTATTVTLDNA